MLAWKAHNSKIRSLAFSRDGRFIATTAGASKFIWLWEASTGQLVRRFWHRSAGVRLTTFHPDGRHILGVLNGRGAGVWDIESGAITAILETDTWTYPDTIAVSPRDGRVVLHVTHGLSEWVDSARPSDQPRPRDREQPIPIPALYYPLQITYSPGGKFFCVLERVVTLLDAGTFQVRREFIDPGGANATAIAFTPDESRFVVAFGRRAGVWRMGPGREKPVQLRGHSLLVRAVGFLADGETVFTAGMDGTARLWDASTGAEQRAFDWGIGKVRVATLAPDGLTCAAGGESGQVVIWDLET